MCKEPSWHKRLRARRSAAKKLLFVASELVKGHHGHTVPQIIDSLLHGNCSQAQADAAGASAEGESSDAFAGPGEAFALIENSVMNDDDQSNLIDLTDLIDLIDALLA